MQKKLFLAALFALPTVVFSQMTKAGKTDLMVAETALGTSIQFHYQQKVDSRLVSVIKNEPISYPVYNVFVVVPSLEKMGETKVDSIENGVETSFRLRLVTKNALTNRVLSTHETTISGVGRSSDEAFVRGLSSIKKTNGELRRTVNAVRQDVRDYFMAKSDSVLLDLQKMVQLKQFGEAFLLANSVPDDAPKHDDIKKLKQSAFDGYQKTACETALTRAQAEIDHSQPPRAVEILAALDPASAPCAAEVKLKLAELETKLDEPTKNSWLWLFDLWLRDGDKKIGHDRTEAEICREILAGDGSKFRFIHSTM